MLRNDLSTFLKQINLLHFLSSFFSLKKDSFLIRIDAVAELFGGHLFERMDAVGVREDVPVDDAVAELVLVLGLHLVLAVPAELQDGVDEVGGCGDEAALPKVESEEHVGDADEGAGPAGAAEAVDEDGPRVEGAEAEDVLEEGDELGLGL